MHVSYGFMVLGEHVSYAEFFGQICSLAVVLLAFVYVVFVLLVLRGWRNWAMTARAQHEAALVG